ncbi:TonB-dependent receptor [Pseudobacteriovorax antillogorgiicola]|uniref:Iron complex outermembrane recepter protein n=1 Tax=Pseudobacteriovorax antillogorgiicola TaxID=1513793 RepID=A0A1Y6CW92_9BACT|nr:TonB-dependent receptor [Pseudobacteriovorax antillogorgiicola]TCS42742.1 iron complex outermembrane receptor protein [Pseudobacteriovorax antillogorgiicola]SMF82213.1 iron complex outermembrane recepter protein [Pseudobacteriovorax antillogorgiicola]
MRKLNLTLGTLLLTQVSLAQEMTLSDILNLEVTTASKTAVPSSEAPATMSVITRNDIELYERRTINEALYSLPGMVPSQDYDRRSISTRGIFEGWNNNHYLILIDGIPHNDNIYGSAYTWDNTPLIFLNQMEVIRGTGSALYGSYAMNGVIGIKSIEAKDFANKTTTKFRLGNRNTTTFDMISAIDGDGVDTVVSFSQSETDGVDFESYDGFANQKRKVQDARSSSYFFSKFTADNGLEFQVHRQDWSFQTGHGWFFIIPEQEEAMKESRSIASLKYNTSSDGIDYEFVGRFQRHEVDWNMNYWPAASTGLDPDSFYASGMWEYLNSHADDLFLRAQFTGDLGNGSSWLLGLEETVFLYSGDQEHYSNLDDINDPNTGNTPSGETKDLGAWLEYIEDQPLYNSAIFAQYVSEKLADMITVTAGVRFDQLSFKYRDLAVSRDTMKNKSFEKVSPRLAIVMTPSENAVVKLMAGSAFRTPSPSELAGYNTWTLASNIEQLSSETVDSAELSFEYQFKKSKFILNLHQTDFKDQIAYASPDAAQPNLSTNIWSAKTQGVELAYHLYGMNHGMFFTASHNIRVDETTDDPGTTAAPDDITWVPASSATLGGHYSFAKVSLASQVNYLGETKRKPSDVPNDLRSESVDASTTIDFKASYNITKSGKLVLSGKNILDEEVFLAKGGNNPFDYQQEKMRYLAGLDFTF